MSQVNKPQKESMGVYEGYQVFTNEEVKQEPLDPEYDGGEKVAEAQNGCAEPDGDKGRIRDLLKQMVENKNKELTVKSVVEHLLQQNEVLLAQSDTQALKPNQRTVKPKSSDQPSDSHGSILTPKDPTAGCSKEDMPNINDALVEVSVSEANKTNCDPDLVCAVGSKIILVTPQGQPLQIDITYYWCNFCSYKSEKKAILLQHVMQHRFHCKYCKYQSFSRAAVIYHCTEEHESFAHTATTLNYCTYLPDLLQKNDLNKRKQDGGEDDAPDAKKARVEQMETLSMEVEEVDNAKTAGAQGQNKALSATSRASGQKRALLAMDGVGGQVVHTTKSSFKAPVVITPISLPSIPMNDGLPVITSVMSGHQAVSAALTTTHTPEPPPPPISPPPSSASPLPPTSGVTVSSGLCWNCGYCGFVTLSQSFLKIHLNAQHQGKAHKYVAMLVSSEEEMTRIKASDAQLVTNPSSAGIVAVTPVVPPPPPPPPQLIAPTPTPPRTTLPAPVPKQTENQQPPGIEIDNAESDAPAKKPEDDCEDEKKIPVSFKCAHCNFSAPQDDKVRVHLFQRHSGSVIYALDMKAVKLRQKRYIFFCLKAKCAFKSKESEDFMEHINSCTPWLDGKDRKHVDAGMVKSLELTKTFIEKTANGVGFGRDTRPEKTAEYACIYCSYISNNNTRLKKHVMTNHADKSCIIKDVPASRSNRKSTVYFCNHCLWETREGSELELHLAERHNATSAKPKPAAEKPSTSAAVKFEEKPSTSGSVAEKQETEKITSSVGRKKRQARVVSDSDSPSPEAEVQSASESSEPEEDTEVNEYAGIIPKDKFNKALAAYIASENPEIRNSRGRPPRSAALKCRIKVKSIKAPPLFKCMHCSEIKFGTILMRAHLQEMHKNEPLRAIDVLKQDRKNPHFYLCFCPSQKCNFCEPVATDIVNHAKNKHGISATHTDLVRIMNILTGPQTTLTPTRGGRPATAATGESYECLYCSKSKLHHSRKDMKKHLIDEHNGEEFIFRDCIARKLRHPSRFYMCHKLVCDFTSEKQKDYLLHMLGHQKAKIFECSKCQWFTSVSGEIDNHLKSVHNGENITTLAIDLDLDSRGNTVKLVGGTVIKTEKY